MDARYRALQEYVGRSVSLSSEEWSTVVSCFRPVSAGKNEFLVPAGTVCSSIYFINSGGVRTFYTQGGKDITRHFFFENGFACALTSFLTRQPSLEALQAMEPTQALCASHADFERLYRDVPGWQELGRKVMEGAYLISTRRIESLICLDATQRYCDLMATFPDVFGRVPQYHIASFLGVEPETLSRIQRKLARQKS